MTSFKSLGNYVINTKHLEVPSYTTKSLNKPVLWKKGPVEVHRTTRRLLGVLLWCDPTERSTR